MYMSQYYQQQRSIRTTITRYREISKIMEDESIGIKSSTRVVTRVDCVCESLKDIVDLSEILDCSPFHKKEVDDKLANGEMCRLCQAEDAEIPALLLKLAWEVSFDRGDGEDQEDGDDDDYDINEDTTELARAAGALSVKKFALANGMKLTTSEELKNCANFFLCNTKLHRKWKNVENCSVDYDLYCVRMLIHELPKLEFGCCRH